MPSTLLLIVASASPAGYQTIATEDGTPHAGGELDYVHRSIFTASEHERARHTQDDDRYASGAHDKHPIESCVRV